MKIKGLIHSLLSVPALIFVLFFSLYAYTSAPTVYTGDSGEISAAAHSLGLAHSTGFPLYLITGHLATKLFPHADPAFVLNLYSAFLVSMGLVFVFFTLRNIRLQKIPTAFATSILGLGQTLWFHTGMADVYALAFLLASILMYTFTSWTHTKELRCVFGYIGIWSLSLGTHVLMTIMVIPLIPMIPYIFKKRTYIGACFLLFILPFVQYLYLFIAYRRNSIVTLGNITNLPHFLSYITQRDYANKISSRNGEQIALFLKKVVTLFSSEFTILFFIAILIGFILLYRRNRSFSVLIASIVTANILMMFFYGNNTDISVLFRYFFLSYLALIIPLAYFLQVLFLKFKQKNWNIPFLIVLISLGLLLEFHLAWKLDNRHTNYVISDFAMNILKTAEPNSIVLSVGDPVTGPLWYLQSIGVRPDVTVIDTNLLNFDWYVENESKRNPNIVNLDLLKLPTKEDRLLSLLNQNISAHHIYSFFIPRDSRVTDAFDLLPVGIVNEITPKGTMPVANLPAINKRNWDIYTVRGIKPDSYKDTMVSDTAEIYSIISSNLGQIYYQAKMYDESQAALERALQFDSRNSIAIQGLDVLSKIKR